MICKQAKAGVPQMRMTDPRLAATQPESGLVTLAEIRVIKAILYVAAAAAIESRIEH